MPSARAGLRRGAPPWAQRLWLGAALGTLLAGCVAERPRPIRPADDLLDPNPTRRVQAVGEAGRLRDLGQVPRLIELLDDEDEAVRLAAGTTLTELTGRDTGYLPYAPAAERRRQVLAWRAWWDSADGRVRERSLRPPGAVR